MNEETKAKFFAELFSQPADVILSTVYEKIHQMYQPNVTPIIVREANSFLSAFQDYNASFDISLYFFSCTKDIFQKYFSNNSDYLLQLLFFLIQTLLFQVRKNWIYYTKTADDKDWEIEAIKIGEFENNVKARIFQGLFDLTNLPQIASLNLVYDKVYQLIAAMIIRSSSPVSDSMKNLFDYFRDKLNIQNFSYYNNSLNSSIKYSENELNTFRNQLISILQFIPDELELPSIRHFPRETIGEDLSDLSGVIMLLYYDTLMSPIFQSYTKMRTIQSLRSWISSSLLRARCVLKHTEMMKSLFSYLRNEEMLLATADCLIDLLSFPTGKGDQFNNILLQILDLQPLFSHYHSKIGSDEDCDDEDDEVKKIVGIIGSFCEANCSLLLPSDPTIAPLFQFLITILRSPHKNVSKGVFDFFVAYGKKVIQHQSSFSNEPLIITLYSTILHTITFQLAVLPSTSDSSSSQSDHQEEENGMQLSYCFLGYENVEKEEKEWGDIDCRGYQQNDDVDEYLEYLAHASSLLAIIYKVLGHLYFSSLISILKENGGNKRVIESSLTILQTTPILASDFNIQSSSSPQPNSNHSVSDLPSLFHTYLSLKTNLPSVLLLIQKFAKKLPLGLVEESLNYITSIYSVSPIPPLISLLAAKALYELIRSKNDVMHQVLASPFMLNISQSLLSNYHHHCKLAQIVTIESITAISLNFPRDQGENALISITDIMTYHIPSFTTENQIRCLLAQFTSFFRVLKKFNGAAEITEKVADKHFITLFHLIQRNIHQEVVVEKFCEMLTESVVTSGGKVEKLMKIIITDILSAFLSHSFCYYLDLFAETISVYKDVKYGEAYYSLIRSVSKHLFGLFSSALSEHSDTVKSYFALLKTFMLNHFENYIIQSEILPFILDLTITSLNFNERHTLRSVLQFFATLIMFWPPSLPLPPLSRVIPPLIKCLAFIDQANFVADVIYEFAQKVEHSQMLSAIYESTSAHCDPHLESQDHQRFANLVCSVKKKHLFRSMISDFARVNKGEMTSDILISYEMIEEPSVPRRRRNAAILS